MNHSVGGWNVRCDHLGIVHLNLAGGCLLQDHGLARGQGVLDLVETHTGGEESARNNVLHGKLLGGLFVVVELLQSVGIQFAEALVHRSENCVGLNTCKVP